jgi:hypothetical protein
MKLKKNFDWSEIEPLRKVWTPNDPLPNSQKCKAPATISRCLALRPLEPVVKAFILEGLEKADMGRLGEGAEAVLLRNTIDEERHDIALERAWNALVTEQQILFDDEAASLIKAWQELPDNPITTAAVLENSVFFVMLPLMNRLGHTALIETSKDISADEGVHVATHRSAAMRLNAPPSKAIQSLRLDTIEYLGQDIANETDGLYTIDKLIKNSNALLTRGISDFIETQVADANAPYEISNASLSGY